MKLTYLGDSVYTFYSSRPILSIAGGDKGMIETYLVDVYILFIQAHLRHHLSNVARKPVFGVPTWSYTNRAVQPQKMARSLKF